MGELSYALLNQSALPPYLKQIGLESSIGILIGMFLVVEAVFKSPMGSLGDHIGRRPLIVCGSLISGAMAIAVTLVHQMHVLMICRAIDGIAAAAVWPTLIAAVSGSVPREKRTMAMNIMTVTYMGGIAFCFLLGGYVNDRTGSKLSSFYLVSVLFFITAVVAFFLTPHRSKEEVEALEDEKETLKFRDIMQGLKALPDMMVLAFLAFFGIGLLIPIIKLFAMYEFHLSETGFGILVLPIALGIGIMSFLAGRLGDRWGKVRSVRLGIGLAAAGMWTVAFSKSEYDLLIASMLLGVGFVLAMPSWLAFVADISAPRLRGTVIGALGTAQGIGAVVGSTMGSYLFKNVAIHFLGLHFKSHYSPFVVSAIALTLSLLLVLIFIREGDCRRIGGCQTKEAVHS